MHNLDKTMPPNCHFRLSGAGNMHNLDKTMPPTCHFRHSGAGNMHNLDKTTPSNCHCRDSGAGNRHNLDKMEHPNCHFRLRQLRSCTLARELARRPVAGIGLCVCCAMWLRPLRTRLDHIALQTHQPKPATGLRKLSSASEHGAV